MQRPSDKRSEMLGNMHVKRLLIKMAIPATIAMFANALYNLVDTIFVAWGAPQEAIGSLAIAFPIQMIILAVGLMIGMGSASIFSRAYGRGDSRAMRRAVNTALTFNTVLAVLLSVAGIVFIEPILDLFGATDGNIDYARDYLFFILIGLIPFSTTMVLHNLLRAEGRPHIAMVSLLIGAGLNIVLDPFLIFGIGIFPALGVQGAAIATLISKSVSLLYVLSASLSKQSNLGIRVTTLHRFDIVMAKDIIVIGFPTFVRNVLGAVVVVTVNRLIRTYAPADVGPELYISVYGVITRMLMFLLLPGLGLVQGLIPIVGFNYGAKFHRRLFGVIRFATRLITVYFMIMFLITLLFAPYLFRLFSPEADPLFIQEGARALRIIAIGFNLIGFQVLLSSVYQAMGYPLRAFLVAISRQLLLFIPLAYIFTSILGFEGIWLTFVTADITAGAVSLLVYWLEMKDLKRKFPFAKETVVSW